MISTQDELKGERNKNKILMEQMQKYQQENAMLASQLKEKEEACNRKENSCQEQEAENGSLKK